MKGIEKYKGNAKLILSKDGKVSVDKVVNFLTKKCNIKLVPVKGQYNSYWLSGKDGYDMIDGNKYYKLVFDSYGIEIKCTGDYNAWSMKGTLVDWFEEGIKKVRSAA